AKSLDRPRGNQHSDRAGGAAQGRAHRKDRQAEQEELPAPDPIGDRAGGQDRGRERDRVRVDDPLKPAETGVQTPGDLGEGGVDDADVEHQHRRSEASYDDGHGAVGSVLPAHRLYRSVQVLEQQYRPSARARAEKLMTLDLRQTAANMDRQDIGPSIAGRFSKGRPANRKWARLQPQQTPRALGMWALGSTTE